jgi:hypothetical protein
LIINWVDNHKAVKYLASYDGVVVGFCIVWWEKIALRAHVGNDPFVYLIQQMDWHFAGGSTTLKLFWSIILSYCVIPYSGYYLKNTVTFFCPGTPCTLFFVRSVILVKKQFLWLWYIVFTVMYRLTLNKQLSIMHIIKCSTTRWQHCSSWNLCFKWCKNKETSSVQITATQYVQGTLTVTFRIL